MRSASISGDAMEIPHPSPASRQPSKPVETARRCRTGREVATSLCWRPLNDAVTCAATRDGARKSVSEREGPEGTLWRVLAATVPVAG
jgi:hypothetical protein